MNLLSKCLQAIFYLRQTWLRPRWYSYKLHSWILKESSFQWKHETVIRVIAKVTTRAQPQWLGEMKQKKIGVWNLNCTACFQCYGVGAGQQICDCGTDIHLTALGAKWVLSVERQSLETRTSHHLANSPFLLRPFTKDTKHAITMDTSRHVAGICGTTHQHE